MADILDELVSRGRLSERDVLRAREAWQGGVTLDQAVLDATDVSEAELLEVLSQAMGLSQVDPTVDLPDVDLLKTAPAKVMTTHRLLPIGRGEDGRVRVATCRPLDRRGLDELRLATGWRLSTVLATGEAIERALAEGLGVGAATMQSLVDESGVALLDESEAGDVDLAEAAADASIIQFVNQILVEAIERRATDVHFEPMEGQLRVRYRIDGILVEATIPPEASRFQPAIVSRLKILSHLDIAEKRLPQDGRIKLRVARRDIDVRVSIIPMLHGEAVVLRILDRGGSVAGLESIGMSGQQLLRFESVLQLPHGIILVTGPTGSGKTTTLYAGLARINTLDRKIVTIEDPIEYQLAGINQIQVDTKTGLSFARGLRSILRHDPDVVLIGEIRDRETAEIAVQASLTGHLVFSTLHTNDAPSAIPRLIDMGVEPYLVASTLEMAIAQRLVRLICKECKTPIDDAETQRMRAVYNGSLPDTLYHGTGCRACNDTGFAGRQGVFEMMPMTEELRALTTQAVPSTVIRKTALQQGMGSLREDGWRLVGQGITTVEEVLRVTKDEQMQHLPTEGVD